MTPAAYHCDLVVHLGHPLVSTLAHTSGCLAHYTVIRPIQPLQPPSPQVLPSKGATYARYWLFHTWCPTCQDQASVIKASAQRYRKIQVYAVPLSGSDEKVQSFLRREGLARLPVLRDAGDAFYTAHQHPVLVLRKQPARVFPHRWLYATGRFRPSFTRYALSSSSCRVVIPMPNARSMSKSGHTTLAQ
jgi:hypothetical protein